MLTRHKILCHLVGKFWFAIVNVLLFFCFNLAVTSMLMYLFELNGQTIGIARNETHAICIQLNFQEKKKQLHFKYMTIS